MQLVPSERSTNLVLPLFSCATLVSGGRGLEQDAPFLEGLKPLLHSEHGAREAHKDQRLIPQAATRRGKVANLFVEAPLSAK